MPEKYKNKYRIASARLASWDYGRNGAYFITICTAGLEHFFGEILNDKMELTTIGEKAEECWLALPGHFQFISLDAHTVMPNHIHGIIVIDKPDNDRGFIDHGGVDDGTVVETGHALSLRGGATPPRHRTHGKNTVSTMIGSFKSAVTNWCNENDLLFGWQTRFHDHIIRDNEEFYRIRNYIIDNPATWRDDKFFHRHHPFTGRR